MLLLYMLTKLLLYSLCCALLAAWYQLPLSSRWHFSAIWGTARLAIGFLFGLPIGLLFLALQNAQLSTTAAYLLAFGPLRVVEWALLWGLIARKHPMASDRRTGLWLLVGTALSMLCDGLALAAGAGQWRFFC